MTSSTMPLRERLISAGLDELAEQGHGTLSLRAVARRAGVSHAAPAYSFGDREGLLAAIVAEGFRRLATEMDAPIPEGRSPLAELGTRYVAFAQQNPALYDVMFRPGEVPQVDDDLDATRRASLRGLVAATTEGDGAPGELTLISWALAHGLAMLDAQGALTTVDPHASPAKLIDAYARRVRPQ